MSDDFIRVNNFQAYSTSLHPRGPKVDYICGNKDCHARGSQRARNFTLRKGRYLAFYCQRCGVKNYLPMVLT